MPRSLVFIIGVELLLNLITLFLLSRQGNQAAAKPKKSTFGVDGLCLFFIALTFLWSIFTGMIFELSHMRLG
ncbi:MAG: hypothetical protein ACO3A2_00535 [Bdellovibrionia bacterium]